MSLRGALRFLRIDYATEQSIRFFASLRMTPCVRSLPGIYTERFGFLGAGSANVLAMTVKNLCRVISNSRVKDVEPSIRRLTFREEPVSV